jgi:hypothetical protein
MAKFFLPIFASLTFVCFLFLTFFVGVERSGVGFSGSVFPWTAFVSTGLSMLLGIFFGSLYRNLASRDGQISILSEFRIVLTTTTFWRAICVAPLVFLALYLSAKDIPGDFPSLLLAFQNGFFWENVLKRDVQQAQGGK